MSYEKNYADASCASGYQEKPLSRIDQMASEMHEAIQYCSNQLDTMESRLSTLMHPDNANALVPKASQNLGGLDASIRPDVQALQPFGNAIGRVRDLSSRLDSILNRLGI